MDAYIHILNVLYFKVETMSNGFTAHFPVTLMVSKQINLSKISFDSFRRLTAAFNFFQFVHVCLQLSIIHIFLILCNMPLVTLKKKEKRRESISVVIL